VSHTFAPQWNDHALKCPDQPGKSVWTHNRRINNQWIEWKMMRKKGGAELADKYNDIQEEANLATAKSEVVESES
jgi:hypothetical protein